MELPEAMLELSQAMKLHSAGVELSRRIKRDDPVGVAQLACTILSMPVSQSYADAMLPFALNLAWALVVSQKARDVISPDDAIASIVSAVAYLSRRDEPKRLAAALNNLGTLYKLCRKGDRNAHIASAIDAYDRALCIYDGLGKPCAGNAAYVLLRLASAQRASSGDPSQNVESAIAITRAALARFEQIGDKSGQAVAHSYLGRCLVNRLIGPSIEAWAAGQVEYENALDLWKALGRDRSATEEALNLGISEVETGRLAADVQLIQAGVQRLKSCCEEYWSRDDDLLELSTIELLIGYGYLIRSNGDASCELSEALQYVERLLDWAQRHADRAAWIYIHSARAFILVGQALTKRDIPSVVAATRAVDAATLAWKEVGLRGRTVPLRLELATALELTGEISKAERLCYEAAHDARAHLKFGISLSSLTHFSKEVYQAHHQLAHLQAQRGDLIASVASLDEGLSLTLHRRASHKRAALAVDPGRRQVESLHEEYWNILASIERRDPRPLNESLDAIRRLVEIEKGLEQTGFTSDAPYGSGVDLTDAIPRGSVLIVPLHATFHHLLCICLSRDEHGDLRATKFECPKISDVDLRLLIANLPTNECLESLNNSLDALGADFGQPLLRHLTEIGLDSVPRVTILVHGLLGLVPFYAANWFTGNSRTYLGDVCELTVIPSLACLQSSVALETGSSADSINALTVSNSRDNLVGARVEGELVFKSLGGKRLKHPNATKKYMMDLLKSARHVHLAGHSDYHCNAPFRSSIQLSNGDNLTVADIIANTQTAPHSMIISSCSSGMSAALDGTSDSWGFPYVLHAWGVRIVISSLWPTLDIAMLLLFAEFYRSRCALTKPVKALNDARRYLRELSSTEAGNRLQEACGEDKVALSVLSKQLKTLVARFGASAPFSCPAIWGAVYCSGTHDLPRAAPPV